MKTNTQQQGWLKLFYQFRDWEWYGDPNMVALFIHLLLRANYKPVRRRGEVYGRGVVLTSREELSHETGISERAIRTCLTRLKTTNEIAIKVTKHGSVITLTNYDKYQNQNAESDQRNDQQNDQPNDQQVTNKRPANDQQTTSSKEIKKERNKEYFVVDEMTREEFFNDFFSEQRTATIEQLCMARAFGSIENFKRLATAVLAEWEALPEPKHRDIKDARQHLINHCSRKMSAERREKQTPTTQNPLTDGTRFSNPAQTKRERTEVFASHIFDKLTRPDTPEFDDGFG